MDKWWDARLVGPPHSFSSSQPARDVGRISEQVLARGSPDHEVGVSLCHDCCEEMSGEIDGRDEELGSVYVFLNQAVDGPAALVLEGEAGIGKSTLWQAGVEAAREQGLRVLLSRPAEAERGLAHAGLGDLFENVLESVLPALSAPRRRALEVALLVEDATDGLDPRTLGVAVRSALDALAAEAPVVLAIDDVQWLDPSSVSSLAFALRRMREQPILLLLARRLGEGAEASELERAIEGDCVERLSVGPLSLGAIHRLLQARLGRTFSRPTLLRVHEVSGGNPFYALELARVLSADVDPMQPLRVPDTLEGLVRARLDGLPTATRQALLLASALGRPSAGLIADAGLTEEVLGPALAASVIEHADGVIRFTHPLLASVLYQSMSADERRRMHGRVAALVKDPLVRARHLALSTEGQDAEVASTLEEAAALANARGAMATTAELEEHALRLTPPNALEDHHRRVIAAARAHFAAGESRRARALAEDLVTGARPGRERVEALILLADVAHFDVGMERRREALREAADHPALRALIHQRLGWELLFTEGLRAAERHARASLELAERLDDDALRAGALAALASVRLHTGEPDALRLAEEANQLAAAAADPQQRLSTGLHLASILLWSGELDRARAFLEPLYQEWRDRDEDATGQLLWRLSLVEFFAGRFALAADYAERAYEIAVQYATDDSQMVASIWAIALVAAHRGDLDLARERAERGALTRDLVFLGGHEGVLGLVALWSGDAREAAAHFAAAEQARRTVGMREPTTFWWRADYVEALLGLGRSDDAVGVLDAWEADAARVGREWALAHATRCRGLVAAARGDIEQALSLLEQAVARHERVGDPFGRARGLLALGVVRRRVRQRRSAREAIEGALESFETAAAVGWAAKARLELGRIGGRTRTEGLTPAEQRVAALVAEGRTNREVAAALFLGERTVETHLSHVYAKLGVRSRAELARTFHGEG
jgi:DNA-binding CsgD family transcriptional regulator